MTEVYGRAIIVRNCGRFLNVASDFGSEYKTHPFFTEQMAYAGLTRENDLLIKNKVIQQEKGVEKGKVPDKYEFAERYNLPTGIYFTCGYLLEEEKETFKLGKKTRTNSDINDFNSIDEQKVGTQVGDRLPKFGNIEWILPHNYFLVFGLAKSKEILESYYEGQTFYLGKKRTMFQIEKLSEIKRGERFTEAADLKLPIQVTNQEIEKFDYYNILTVTQRYILVNGKTKPLDSDVDHLRNYRWNLSLTGMGKIELPGFFVNEKLGIK